MNTKIVGIIAVLIAVMLVGVYMYAGSWEWPIDDTPADITGVWSSSLVIVDTSGNEHLINSDADAQTITWQGYNVDSFYHNLGINPTNIDGQAGMFSTITVAMPITSYASEYSIASESGTIYINHAQVGLNDPVGSEINGDYTFNVDAGTQLVSKQFLGAGAIEAVLGALGASYGTYILTFHMSGDFQYYVDNTNDWQDITLGQIDLDVTFDWTQTTMNIVNIDWDHTSGGSN